MLILKADGSKEPFSEAKLIASIQRAGVPQDLQTQTLLHIHNKLHEGISTAEIYHHIQEFLKPRPYVAKYSLKRALMEIGPSGYPFEDFLAHLIGKMGYQTKVRTVVQGTCISHEIDIIATLSKADQTREEKIMIEAKYHNTTGIKTDVHVGLYTKARFDDVKDRHHFTKALLITNTKVTSDVIAYAQCVGMDLLSWDYPEHNSLRELLQSYQLFPITALSSLSLSNKQQLLAEGIVLCADICHRPEILDGLHLSDQHKMQLLSEAQFVCNIENSKR